MLSHSLTKLVESLKEDLNPISETNTLPDVFDYYKDNNRVLRWMNELSEGLNSKAFNIQKVLQKLGVKVHFEDLGSNIDLSGYLELRGQEWHIGVNKYEVTGRQRFTMAHELAHLLFHRNIIINKMENNQFKEAIKLFRADGDIKHIEMEANSFAAELLMPSSKFRDDWLSNKTITQVANEYNVSNYAAEFRAKKLRLPSKDS